MPASPAQLAQITLAAAAGGAVALGLSTQSPALSAALCASVAGLAAWAWLARSAQRDSLTAQDRALAEQRAELSAVVDASGEAIVSFDDQGQIFTFNRAAERLFGWPAAEARARPFASFFAEGKYQRTVADTVEGSDGPTALRRDGSLVPVLLTTARTTVNGRPASIAVLRDVTALREAQRAASQARDEAQHASRAKSAFLASTSHELRTPLNAIIGYAELLSEDAEDAMTRADLSRILVAARHQLALVDDVLDLARIEAGRMQLVTADVDVHALGDALVDTITPIAAAKGTTVTLALSPQSSTPWLLHTDAKRLRQVLLNLLGNAAKFTHNGQITLALTGNADHSCTAEVIDTGLGMSEAQQARIFDPYVQAEADTAHHFGGTGLGLAICRELCREAGGEISVRSTLGQGTTFTVRWPDARPAVEVTEQSHV